MVEPAQKRNADSKISIDRDLSIAGRAMVKDANGSIAQKLVKIERPSRSNPLEATRKTALTFVQFFEYLLLPYTWTVKRRLHLTRRRNFFPSLV